MTDPLYQRRVRCTVAISAALHLLALATWQPWQPSDAPEVTDEPIALVLIEAPPPPPQQHEPRTPPASEPVPVLAPIAAPDIAQSEQPEPTPQATPETVAFVFADQAELDSLEHVEGEVISAVTDEAQLNLAAEIVAPEAGKQAPQRQASQAAPTSVAVAAAAGTTVEAQHAAPEAEAASASVEGAANEGADTTPLTELADAENALVGGDLGADESRPEQLDAPDAEDDGQADAEVEQLAGHDGHTVRDDDMAPSIALSGASGAAGGAATSTQAVIDDADRAMRARTRRASTPLGRYTQRVYRAVQRRWHDQPVQPTPIAREVTVTFSIRRLGRVDRVQLASSSGDPMLDAVAQASVPKRLAPFPAELHERTIRQEITFRYMP